MVALVKGAPIVTEVAAALTVSDVESGVSANGNEENGVPVVGARDLLACVLTSSRRFCLAVIF